MCWIMEYKTNRLIYNAQLVYFMAAVQFELSTQLPFIDELK